MSTRSLELVTLKGGTGYVVRDITDLSHPFTVSTLGGLAPFSGPKAAYNLHFASPSEVSYYDDSDELLRKAFDGAAIGVTHPCNYLFAFAWSPDGTNGAYATDDASFSSVEMHLIASGTDRSVGSAPAVPLTGCVAPCEDFVDLRALYSPDGRYFSFASSWSAPYIRVWTSAGVLAASMDGADRSGPSMTVWSGSGLYFRDRKGVEVWRDGKTSLVLPGVSWIAPRAAAGTPEIVYEAKDASGLPSVFLLDPSSGQARRLATLRSEPVLLNPTTIWYRGQRVCRPGDPYPCGAEVSVFTGQTYVYDLATGIESQSLIDGVWDVWPHPA